ncbi:hypothetical protein ACFPIJ_28745 [Dactylosporangium cerinum]|uniref:Uncharacterized protein n=1 Tax=Dactylosporangium cerinum TaxID=1434730 RepID=A0ABV9W187_9ACTN
MSYELGVALGIAVLGTLQAMFYRSSLPDLSALPDHARTAVVESLAAGSHVLAGAGDQEAQVLAAARNAFAQSMQVTSTIAAVLLVVAGVIAWKAVPSRRGPDLNA